MSSTNRIVGLVKCCHSTLESFIPVDGECAREYLARIYEVVDVVVDSDMVVVEGGAILLLAPVAGSAADEY